MSVKTTTSVLTGLFLLCTGFTLFAQRELPPPLPKREQPSILNSPVTKKMGVLPTEKTPFIGHIDVDYMAIKPGISFQNMEPSFATHATFFSDLWQGMGIGMSNSTGLFTPNTAFITLTTDLLFHDDFGPEFMRLQYGTGALGIGTSAPFAGSKLHVVQPNAVFSPGVVVGQSAAPDSTFSDIAGVYGQNNVDDFYGIGVRGNGGWQGVIGEVSPTGSFAYVGVNGSVIGGSGTNYGLFGNTFGAGTNYGIYASAFGGTANYAGYFVGQVSSLIDRSLITAFNQGIDIEASGTSGSYIGFTGRYSDLANQGAGIFINDNGTGINIGDAIGFNFFAVNASAFNIMSDRRLKKDITTITPVNAGVAMEQLRNIESATFWYESEDKSKRPVPHVGVIAQSLPQELQTEISGRPDGSSPDAYMGVSLSDWLGLVTIGVKENDRRLLLVEQRNKALSEENALLKAKLAALEAKSAQLEQLTAKMEQLSAKMEALGATKAVKQHTDKE